MHFNFIWHIWTMKWHPNECVYHFVMNSMNMMTLIIKASLLVCRLAHLHKCAPSSTVFRDCNWYDFFGECVFVISIAGERIKCWFECFGTMVINNNCYRKCGSISIKMNIYYSDVTNIANFMCSNFHVSSTWIKSILLRSFLNRNFYILKASSTIPHFFAIKVFKKNQVETLICFRLNLEP